MASAKGLIRGKQDGTIDEVTINRYRKRLQDSIVTLRREALALRNGGKFHFRIIFKIIHNFCSKDGKAKTGKEEPRQGNAKTCFARL